MSCYTSFVLASANGQETYINKECKDALKQMQDLKAPSQTDYVNRVTIAVEHKFSTKTTDAYRLLSQRQFQCLLRCAMNTKDIPYQKYCNHSCFAVEEKIQLNWLDTISEIPPSHSK